MIQWSLALSESQIALLTAMNDFDRWRESHPQAVPNSKDRAAMDLYFEHSPFSRFNHFLSHARGLLRDGLIRHSDSAGRGHEWAVTEKGRLVLRVIEIELQEIKSRPLLGDGIPQAKYRAVAADVDEAKKRSGKATKPIGMAGLVR